MDGLKLAHAVRHRWPPIELFLPPVISMCRRATFLRGVYFFQSHIVTTKYYLLSKNLLPKMRNT